MGTLALWIGGELFWLIRAYCRDHQLGWVFPNDTGFQGFPESPRTVRKPDVSFVRFGRFPGEQLPPGWARLAPDLAAEVISPNDLYEEVDQKIEEYLRAGVRRVWVVVPQTRLVRVYRPDGTSVRLGEDDELDGEDVLPGFRCRVRDLFPQPPAAPANGSSPAAP